jgi:hypothetical protein
MSVLTQLYFQNTGVLRRTFIDLISTSRLTSGRMFVRLRDTVRRYRPLRCNYCFHLLPHGDSWFLRNVGTYLLNYTVPPLKDHNFAVLRRAYFVVNPVGCVGLRNHIVQYLENFYSQLMYLSSFKFTQANKRNVIDNFVVVVHTVHFLTFHAFKNQQSALITLQ